MKNEIKTLTEILQNRTLYYFYQLCQIPRGSGNEKAVSNYIYKWANEQELEVKQDKIYNIIIKKRATEGYETAEPILLQAHLDMVCDKEPNSYHDFLKEPILWKIEEDWISSAVGTSLGADCGVGVALIMAILEKKTISHPALEVLLTVREETDMEGAYQVNPSDFVSKKLINLDISPDDRLLAGSCGGAAVEMTFPLRYEAVPMNYEGVIINLSGLRGGHSGADIHKGRGNAILMLIQCLRVILNQTEGRLVYINGGNSRLAIPRDAEMSLLFSKQDMKKIDLLCSEFNVTIKEEYTENAPQLQMKKTEAVEKIGISKEDVNKILMTGLFWPNEIQKMSNILEGSVESSSNLGVIETRAESIKYITEVRSTYPTSRQMTIMKIQAIADMLNGECSVHSTYPEWRYKKDSAMRDKVLSIYYKREQKEMMVFSAHAGNEIGILYSRLNLSDAVAIGPSRYFYHSPKEVLSISSTIRFESFLEEILSNMI